MTNELERMWKETLVDYFKIVPAFIWGSEESCVKRQSGYVALGPRYGE
jgi:hypothetical protein